MVRPSADFLNRPFQGPHRVAPSCSWKKIEIPRLDNWLGARGVLLFGRSPGFQSSTHLPRSLTSTLGGLWLEAFLSKGLRGLEELDESFWTIIFWSTKQLLDSMLGGSSQPGEVSGL